MKNSIANVTIVKTRLDSPSRIKVTLTCPDCERGPRKCTRYTVDARMASQPGQSPRWYISRWAVDEALLRIGVGHRPEERITAIIAECAQAAQAAYEDKGKQRRLSEKMDKQQRLATQQAIAAAWVDLERCLEVLLRHVPHDDIEKKYREAVVKSIMET